MSEIKSTRKNNENHKQLQAQNDEFAVNAQHSVSGPLPSASEMQGYNSISPDLVDRIVSMAEKESNFRHDMERNSLKINEKLALNHQKERKLGQYLGAFIAICCLLTSITLGFYGLEIAAGTVGGTTVLGLVAVFVTGRSSKSD